MKKQTAAALVLLLLIPVVFTVGGWLLSAIDPELAAGHPNYARNYHYLSLARIVSFRAMLAVVAILWLGACFLLIRSKQRSSWWLLLAPFGPFGFAALAMLRDRAPAEADRHERSVWKLNWFVRAGYHVCKFAVIWMLAYQAMVLKRNLMIQYQSATTGMSPTQIVAQQNASSGMWAFAEGNEVMFMVVVLYLLWPIVFNVVSDLVARITATTASAKAR
jgi:hypothetical protein